MALYDLDDDDLTTEDYIDHHRTLLIEADSYLSLLRWRYATNLPQDLKTEIDNLIAHIRNTTGV